MRKGIGISHTGMKRVVNEDTIHIDTQGRFAILADGMGGHRGGKQASEMAVQMFSEKLQIMFKNDDRTLEIPERMFEFLTSLFQEVSAKVFERGENDPTLKGMGTTAVVWVSLEKRTFVAHVGDSRCYLLFPDSIFQVTADHNFLNENIENGVDRGDLPKKYSKHTIFRNIGAPSCSHPTIFTISPEREMLWLLCSDGLSDLLSAEDFLEQTSRFWSEKEGFPKILENLITLACERGGHDNISAILLES